MQLLYFYSAGGYPIFSIFTFKKSPCVINNTSTFHSWISKQKWQSPESLPEATKVMWLLHTKIEAIYKKGEQSDLPKTHIKPVEELEQPSRH